MCIHSLFRLQLRPCPMPENPKILRNLVKNAEANSLVFEAEKKE